MSCTVPKRRWYKWDRPKKSCTTISFSMSVVGGGTSKSVSQSAKSTFINLKYTCTWYLVVRNKTSRFAVKKGKRVLGKLFYWSIFYRLSGISVALEVVMGRCSDVCPEIHMRTARAKLKDFYANWMLLATYVQLLHLIMKCIDLLH